MLNRHAESHFPPFVNASFPRPLINTARLFIEYLPEPGALRAAAEMVQLLSQQPQRQFPPFDAHLDVGECCTSAARYAGTSSSARSALFSS